MRSIRVLDLGRVSAVRSQTVYHAAAYAMTGDRPDTVILVSPDQPYVCVGYHQDLEKEVDLAYCWPAKRSVGPAQRRWAWPK
jgi:lipoate-protein ligase A